MGVCKAAVCRDCKCYVDLDKIDACWEGSYWIDHGVPLSECYSVGHVQMLVRFLVMHHNHEVEILYDNSDEYFDAEKNYREIDLEDLADDV